MCFIEPLRDGWRGGRKLIWCARASSSTFSLWFAGCVAPAHAESVIKRNCTFDSRRKQLTCEQPSWRGRADCVSVGRKPIFNEWEKTFAEWAVYLIGGTRRRGDEVKINLSTFNSPQIISIHSLRTKRLYLHPIAKKSLWPANHLLRYGSWSRNSSNSLANSWLQTRNFSCH